MNKFSRGGLGPTVRVAVQFRAYAQPLLRRVPDVHGKTIRRFRFTNDIDYHCVSIDFEDDSVLAFKLELGIDEEAELGIMRNGNLEDIRPLKPVPVRRSI